MAWEDRTPFEAILFQFGLSEKEVIKLMRGNLKASSFKRWRKRLNSGVSQKHLKNGIRIYHALNVHDKRLFQEIKSVSDNMQYNKQDISDLDRITKLKIINSVTGIKPANLIGTIDNKGNTNLAVFSSVVHLGSNPALIGFIARPQTQEVGHTFQNIRENGTYTINHIHPEFIKQAHYTSAKFDKNTSEFERCGLTEQYVETMSAPFVKESDFKMGMRFKEAIPIPINGTTLIIGEIEHLLLPDIAMNDGDIDLELSNSIGISGLNSYYEIKKITTYPYVRVNEVPKF